MELKIIKTENGGLVAILPDDLAQLPTQLKNFLASQAALAEPSAKLAEVQAENQTLKVKVAELSGQDYLKSRLANLNEDTYIQLGRELGFLELEDAGQSQNLAEKDGLPPGAGKASGLAESPHEEGSKPGAARVLKIVRRAVCIV